MRINRYTPDQVIRGINFFTSDYLGSEFSLRLDSPLHMHLKTLTDLEICPLEFLEELAAYFDIDLPQDRVLGWLRLRKNPAQRRRSNCSDDRRLPESNRTGNDLVNLIVRRAKCPDFSARCILGHSCQKAGYFIGIRSMITKNNNDRIAPSTQLRRVMSSAYYRDLINRLSWMLDREDLERVALPGKRWQDSPETLLTFLAIASWLWATNVYTSFGIVISLIGVSVVGILSMVASHCLVERIKLQVGTEMAPGVFTFRDLTQRLAANRLRQTRCS